MLDRRLPEPADIPFDDFFINKDIIPALQGEERIATYFNTSHFFKNIKDTLDQNSRVVDVGCAGGFAVRAMAGYFSSQIVGVDVNQEFIDFAKNRTPDCLNPRISFEVLDARQLAEKYVAKVDLITAFEVLHNFENPKAILNQFYKALRPGGYFVATDLTPQLDALGKDLYTYRNEVGEELFQRALFSGWYDRELCQRIDIARAVSQMASHAPESLEQSALKIGFINIDLRTKNRGESFVSSMQKPF